MKLTIIGASGHGRVVADVARLNGYDEIEFLDDDVSRINCGKWPVSGAVNKAAKVENDLFVAIGSADVRERIMEHFKEKHFPVLIHPAATVAEDVEIGWGSVVMAGAVINSAAKIGKGCIINTLSSVDHDCVIGNYTHISVGAHLGGTVVVGNKTWISIGANVINNVSICDDCTIGAGAAVIRNIGRPGTYVGIPARMII